MAAVVAVISSCSEENRPTGDNWGTTEWYPDRFYCSYTPVVMTRTVEFDLNEDARLYLDCQGGFFELAVSKEPGEYVKSNDIKVYYNGMLDEDGKFHVTLNDDKSGKFTADIGVEFVDGVAEGIHKYYIVYTGQMDGNNSINVQGTNLTASKEYVTVDMCNLDAEGFYVEKIDLVNPVDKILIWVGTILGICLAVWIIVGRYLFFPRIRVSRLQFTGPDTFNRTPTVKGCYRVVLTADRKRKQGIIARLFTGKILYIYDDVWTEEVLFEHRNKKSVRIRTKGDWTCDSFSLEKHNSYIIENMTTKQKGEITVV